MARLDITTDRGRLLSALVTYSKLSGLRSAGETIKIMMIDGTAWDGLTVPPISQVSFFEHSGKIGRRVFACVRINPDQPGETVKEIINKLELKYRIKANIF